MVGIGLTRTNLVLRVHKLLVLESRRLSRNRCPSPVEARPLIKHIESNLE